MNFSDKNSHTYTMPKTAGYYRFRVTVKDADGKTLSKELSAVVKKVTGKKLQADGKTGTANISMGGSVTAVASPTGGTAPYQYRYSYKTGNSKWVYTDSSYVYSERRKITFPKNSGTYTLRIQIRDQGGKTAEKKLTVNVKSLSISHSSVNKTTMKTEDTVKLTAKASYKTGTVKYRYSYKAEGKSWTYLGNYTTAGTKNLKIRASGIYSFRVEAKDSAGTYTSKEFKITVYSKSAKKVNKATQLQTSANWKSKTAAEIPKGAKVYVIKSTGHWFMVKYQNNIGYVYNLALGSYKNYSVIDTTTIGDVADDIIYYNGKSIKGVYDYLCTMGRVSNKNLGYEENIAYIMRYKRGACYQRSSLMCYLLRRIGYEAMRITDGRSGTYAHNWVIVKTSKGWRHIDPTDLIACGRIYLKTDKQIERYLTWGRSKYPKCE